MRAVVVDPARGLHGYRCDGGPTYVYLRNDAQSRDKARRRAARWDRQHARGDALPPPDRRLQPPAKWVAAYERRLRNGPMAEVRRVILEEVGPVLRAMKREQAERRRRGDQTDEAARVQAALLNAAAKLRASRITVLDIGEGVASYGIEGSKAAVRAFAQDGTKDKRIRAIDIGATESKRAQLSAWAKDQADLVSSIPRDSISRLSSVIAKNVRAGTDVREVAAMIERQFEIDSNRAALIARTEVAKLNAAVQHSAMQRAGASEYVWQTVEDERVRPMHAELDGTTQRFDDPPVTNEAGDRNNPGSDYQCRCVATPVFAEFDEAELDAALAAGGDEVVPF